MTGLKPNFTHQLRNPQLMEAALALSDNRLHDAEPLLKQHLKDDPLDVAAIRMLAELAGRIGRYKDAESLLRRAIELSPNFFAARSNLATVLHRQNRSQETLEELDQLIALDPGNISNTNLKAAALGRLGDYDEAITLYEQLIVQLPKQPKIWMSFGHILKTVGRQADSVAAYRRALALHPGFGEAWWSLANLKTMRFSDTDIIAMEQALNSENISHADRLHLHFAIGKAHEDRKAAKLSFYHYAAGNRLRKAELGYNADETCAMTRKTTALFTPAFLESRLHHGHDTADPIFIVGMPRAGSTLIEQILSSHSMIEGTMELPDIPALAAKAKAQGGISAQSADSLRLLGEAYLARTRIQRKTTKAFFIDKLPNNWLHIGFIHLILPNARIIDARRDAMDCCFSNFKQHFARGQSFSYDLTDMGRYYTDYIKLMSHFDIVLPGRVHRVMHEALLDDPEKQVQELLSYLKLPFENKCLRFYENDRAVRTASSEQVRRPLNRDGVGQWRMYEPWLEPLKTALQLN